MKVKDFMEVMSSATPISIWTESTPEVRAKKLAIIEPLKKSYLFEYDRRGEAWEIIRNFENRVISDFYICNDGSVEITIK